ncbi:MAG: tetratricopeptide repeat protein [Chloroflexota bacterium]
MQPIPRGEDYAVVFGRLLAKAHTSIRRLARLSGVSRRTLENWLDGTVRRPRHWEPILQIGRALHLSAAEVDSLLLAAGQPSLTTLQSLPGLKPNAELLILWQSPTTHSDRERSQSLLRSGLPAPATPFIGRERQLPELATLLARADVRLVTVTGPGGIGKTRVAIEAARRATGLFPDGVFFISLESVGTADALVDRLIMGLAIHRDPAIPRFDAIVGFLGESQALLVLDTFENVLPSAVLIAQLIQGTPHLKILVTSRAVLRLTGEHIVTLPPLTVGSADADPAIVAHYEAVKLFLARVREVRPDFTLTANNVDDVLAICRIGEGLPLALELAAGQTRVLSLPELRRQLKKDPSSLAGGPRDAPLRHRSMQETIAWSHNLLDEKEQVLFRRISIYRDGCTLAAAKAVNAGDRLTEDRFIIALTGLLDQSLLQFQRIGDQRIYRMHNLTRQFAFAQLIRSGELDSVMSQLLDYLEALAESVDQHMRDSERNYWLGQFDPESNNVWLVMEWGLDTEQPPIIEQCLRLCSLMLQYWNLRGQVDLARKWTDQALKAARQAGLPNERQIGALLTASALALIQADGQSSSELSATALNSSRQTKDWRAEAHALHLLGMAAYYHGDLATAGEVWNEALQVCEQLGDGSVTARALDDLGNLASRQGDFELSLALHQREQQASLAAGDVYSEFYAVLNLGDVSIRLNRLSEAEMYNRRAQELSRQMGDARGLAHTLITQARLLRQLDRLPEARDLLLEALALSWRIQNLDIVLTALEQLLIVGAIKTPFAQIRLMSMVHRNRGRYGPSSYPEDDAALQVLAKQLRQQMGTEPYGQEWDLGQILTWEEAIAQGMNNNPGATHLNAATVLIPHIPENPGE